MRDSEHAATVREVSPLTSVNGYAGLGERIADILDIAGRATHRAKLVISMR